MNAKADERAQQARADRIAGERLRRIFELLHGSPAGPAERMKVLQSAAAKEIARLSGKGLPANSPDAVWWPGLLVQLPPERVHDLVAGIAQRLEAARNARFAREGKKAEAPKA